MIKKHASNSMKIHEELTKKYSGYTFHSLSNDQMEIIIDEIYHMYLIVQNFLNNMTMEEKNYINVVENLFESALDYMKKNNCYYCSEIIFKSSKEEYINRYKINPPTINFYVLI